MRKNPLSLCLLPRRPKHTKPFQNNHQAGGPVFAGHMTRLGKIPFPSPPPLPPYLTTHARSFKLRSSVSCRKSSFLPLRPHTRAHTHTHTRGEIRCAKQLQTSLVPRSGWHRARISCVVCLCVCVLCAASQVRPSRSASNKHCTHRQTSVRVLGTAGAEQSLRNTDITPLGTMRLAAERRSLPGAAHAVKSCKNYVVGQPTMAKMLGFCARADR